MGALDRGSANRKVLPIQENTTHRKTHPLMSRAGLEHMSPVLGLLKTYCRKPTGHSDRPRYLSWLELRRKNKSLLRLINLKQINIQHIF
jgi:hypothetical protein